jgi:hypothetical protein
MVEDRIVEALEFVAGHAVAFQIVLVRRAYTVETTVRTRRDGLATERWEPPLKQLHVAVPGKNRSTSRHHRRLFDRFFLNAIAGGTAGHSISGQLAAVREASASRYIDAYALTLTVAIESLLASAGRARVSRRPSAREIQTLLAWMERWEGSDDLKARARGAVAQLRERRAGDVMRALAKKGAVTKEQYDAWQKLRNRSAHRYQLHSATSPDELRQLLPQVVVLFYHLIFYAIGYKGPYTDYSSTDWPVREYPARAERPR